jgi:hypothetical protein
MRSLMSPLGHNAQPYRTCKPIVFFIMHAGDEQTQNTHPSHALSYTRAQLHTHDSHGATGNGNSTPKLDQDSRWPAPLGI